MSLELVTSNTVIVAQQFNPTVMGQHWLIREGLLDEGDFRKGCVYTDMLVQVQSEEFNLMVVPQQCQLAPRVDRDREQELIVEKVGTIARKLPHTPFRGIGLNFTWHLNPEERDVASLSRELFFIPDGPLHQEFTDKNSRYGAYMSKDAFGGRLKLDVKPTTLEREGQEEERIVFAFNFHRDLEDEKDPVGSIEQMLQQWNAARDESSRIVHATVKGEPV